jgi:nitrate/nitrite transport system substrate-binding protein
VVSSILEASRWIDANDANRSHTARTIAHKAYVNTPVETIEGRVLGNYENGLGKKWKDPHPMRFYSDGVVTYPWLSDGMWFLTQHRRWGLLKTDPDYLAIAKKVNRIDLYKQAATAVNVSIPKELTRISKLMDGVTWDPARPARYVNSFSIKVA